MEKAKILIIDDEKLLRWSLEQNLTKEGYVVISAESGMKGLKLLSEDQPDIVLLDIHLPDISGINILEKIKKEKKHPIVIMITAFGDIETAVKAIKLGAYDFVEKPFNLDKLKILLSKAVETGSLREEVSHFKSQLTSQFSMNSIVGQSDQMKEVKALVKKVAQSDASTIFLHGESGTGKDLIAKVIHYSSERSDKPFMDINCTALPETLIESELFGYEKGAFTDAKVMKKGFFELADAGTIYLDEIADMKSSTQAKLLKVIENKTFKRIGGVKDIAVDIRIIASSNKNIEEEIRNGNFREDLYYRLQVIPLRLPPLRERSEDIIFLTNAFINQFNNEFKKHANPQGLWFMMPNFCILYRRASLVRFNSLAAFVWFHFDCSNACVINSFSTSSMFRPPGGIVTRLSDISFWGLFCFDSSIGRCSGRMYSSFSRIIARSITFLSSLMFPGQ